MRKDYIKQHLTPGMIAWSVVMIIELVILIIAIRNILVDPLSKGDLPFIASAICVLSVGCFSLRKEWKTKMKDDK